MRKFFACFLALMLGLLVFISVPSKAADKVTITVYNWGQYISDGTDGYIDVIKEFEKKYPNIKVNYMTFDSNETLYTKLQSGGSSFDVIIPSDYMIDTLISEDMLEPLDFSNIPNYKYVDEAYKNLAYDPENKYSVPYTWGCVGVIYNPKYSLVSVGKNNRYGHPKDEVLETLKNSKIYRTDLDGSIEIKLNKNGHKIITCPP